MSERAHLSNFVLDELALEALSREETERARHHLETCAQCQARAEEGAQLRANFAKLVERTLAAVQQRNRSWRRWFAVRFAVPVVAIAACVLVLLRPRAEPTAIPTEPEFGIKGSLPVFEVFARRDQQVFAVKDGSILVPGDELRFAVVPQGATYVLVASIDGSGAVTMYYPYNAERSAEVDPGRRTELPGSIVLDAAPGPERLVAAFSRTPIRAVDLAAELRRHGAGRGSASSAMAGPLMQATQVAITFEKAR